MIHKIYKIEFKVENCPAEGISTCVICFYHFKKAEIRIAYRKSIAQILHYHLNCFSPMVPQFIKGSDIKNILVPESSPIFEEWLRAWNSKFFPLDRTPVISNIPKKSLPTIPHTRKRTLIEIFKYLPILDTNSSLPLVCKEFYEICWDNELWHSYLSRDFNIICPYTESKSNYIKQYNNLCISCKTFPSEITFHRCPYLKKTICKNCLRKEEFELMHQADIKISFGVNLKSLKLNYATSTVGSKLSYVFKILREVYKYREKQKEKILQMSQIFGDDHQFVNLIKNIDVKKLDSKKMSPYKIKRMIYKEFLDESIKWKFYQDVQKFIRTGNLKILKERLVNSVNKRFKSETISQN